MSVKKNGIRLIFLRHGACEGGNILRGSTDVALSAEGEMQMQRRTDGLLSRYGVPAQILTSPKRRCYEFATQKAAELGLAAGTVDAFAEMHYGDWDGQSFDEIYCCDAKAVEAFYQNPWDNPAPAGETMQSFEQRVTGAFEQLCDVWLAQSASHTDKPVWVVCHAGVMLVLMAHILGLKQQPGLFNAMSLPYATAMEVTVLRHDGRNRARLHWPG